MSKSIRIGVVGAGQFGTLHAETLSHLSGASVAAIVDGDQDRARSLAERWNVPRIFPTATKMLASGTVDAAVIATRTDSHLPLAGEILSAGLPVLVEKPLANSAEEIRRFQANFESAEAKLMVDHLCLFHSSIVPLLARLRDTGFRALHFVRHRPDQIGQRFPKEHPIQLMMVHDLYVAAKIVGDDEPCAFAATETRNAQGRVDMSWATLRWANDRIATFQSHLMLPDGSPADGWDSLEVFGDKFHSKAVTNPAPWTWTDSQTTWPKNLEISPDSGMLAVTLQHFLGVCRGKPVPEGCRLQDALRVQTWIEQLLKIAANSC